MLDKLNTYKTRLNELFSQLYLYDKEDILHCSKTFNFYFEIEQLKVKIAKIENHF